jgi:YD repeat-containing protein
LSADGATYTAVNEDQSVWTFDNKGRLSAINDRFQNVSTLTTNPTTGRLDTVSDPAGRGSLGFRYDTYTGAIASYTIAGNRTMACQPGRLCEVSDWSGRTVQYGYDGSGRLTDVIDREQVSLPAVQRNSTRFTYDSTTSRLTSITDANNHAAVNMTYDSQGRVQYQWDAADAA